MSHSKKKLDLSKPVRVLKPVVDDIVISVETTSTNGLLLVVYKDKQGYNGKRSTYLPTRYFNSKKSFAVVKESSYGWDYTLVVIKKKNSKRNLEYVVPSFLLTNVNGTITKLNMHGGRKW